MTNTPFMMQTLRVLALVAVCLIEAAVAAGQAPVARELASDTRHSTQARVLAQDDGSALLDVSDNTGSRRRIALDASTLALPPRANEISRVIVSPNGRFAGVLVGDRDLASAGVGAREVVLADLASTGSSRVAALNGFEVTPSPDGRWIAFQVHQRRNEPNASARYAVIDLDAPLTDDGQPRITVFYPSEGGGHVRQSRLFWVTPTAVAFVDDSQPEATARLVVAEIEPGPVVSRIVTKALDNQWVNEAARQRGDTSLAPSAAFANAVITRIEGDGLRVRLKFPAGSFLTVRRLDIQVW